MSSRKITVKIQMNDEYGNHVSEYQRDMDIETHRSMRVSIIALLMNVSDLLRADWAYTNWVNENPNQ